MKRRFIDHSDQLLRKYGLVFRDYEDGEIALRDHLGHRKASKARILAFLTEFSAEPNLTPEDGSMINYLSNKKSDFGSLDSPSELKCARCKISGEMGDMVSDEEWLKIPPYLRNKILCNNCMRHYGIRV